MTHICIKVVYKVHDVIILYLVFNDIAVNYKIVDRHCKYIRELQSE
jgi:hypothetical protein